MAHQPTQGHKQKHKAQAHEKSSKASKAAKSPKHQSKGAIKHLEKQSGAIKKPPKIKKTVSAAGMFKKHRKHKQPTPEPDLMQDLRSGIYDARAAIDANLEAAFNIVHDFFLHQLTTARSNDITFFEHISATAFMLSAPLAEEQIETTFTRDGKRVTEIVEIGKRIAMFKKSVEKDAERLKGYWAQWEELQDDFVELGAEVYGLGVLVGEDGEREVGDRKEMERLDAEHDDRVQELRSEVKEMSEEVLQEMAESEMELNVSDRKQRANLLHALIADER